MNYTNLTNVENYALQEIATAYEPQVTEWIEAVSRMFDQMANRVIVAAPEESGQELEARYFDGNGRAVLPIDECVELGTVKVGDQFGANLTAITDYVRFPRTGAIRRLTRQSGVFERGIQNVEITGRWGYLDELPKDLEFAATVVVAGIINAQRPTGQAKKSEKIGNYQVTYADDRGVADYSRAMAIVESYRRHSL